MIDSGRSRCVESRRLGRRRLPVSSYQRSGFWDTRADGDHGAGRRRVPVSSTRRRFTGGQHRREAGHEYAADGTKFGGRGCGEESDGDVANGEGVGQPADSGNSIRRRRDRPQQAKNEHATNGARDGHVEDGPYGGGGRRQREKGDVDAENGLR